MAGGLAPWIAGGVLAALYALDVYRGWIVQERPQVYFGRRLRGPPPVAPSESLDSGRPRDCCIGWAS